MSSFSNVPVIVPIPIIKFDKLCLPVTGGHPLVKGLVAEAPQNWKAAAGKAKEQGYTGSEKYSQKKFPVPFHIIPNLSFLFRDKFTPNIKFA